MRRARWLYAGLLLALLTIAAWPATAQQPGESKVVLDRLEQVEKRLSQMEMTLLQIQSQMTFLQAQKPGWQKIHSPSGDSRFIVMFNSETGRVMWIDVRSANIQER